MFVYSIKTSKGKMLAAIAITAAVIILLILIFAGTNSDAAETAAKGKVNLSANTAAERVQFLSQFGWEVKEEPLEVTEVMIPEEFDDTYTEYNEIQKKQNMDLSKLKGKKVKRWTYEVTNYPKQTEGVRANLLVLDGKVVGGDICSNDAANGFMHGFSLDTATANGIEVTYDVTSDGTIVTQGAADSQATDTTTSSEAVETDASVENPQTGDDWE